MGIGVSPILTRQLCAAMFALSGHIFFAICLALGLLQIQPGRSISRKPPVVQVHLTKSKPTTPAIPNPAPEPATPTIPSPAPATPTIPNPVPTPALTTLPNPASAPVTSPTSAPSAPAVAREAAAVPEAAPVDIPYYHSLKQLTEKPRVIEDSASGMNLILPGVETQNVILRLLINEQGLIDQVEIEHSTLMSNIEAVVIAAFAKLRFSPGKIDGVAVKCQLQIEVSLENADSPALQRLPVQ